jgi:hypothetical protein
MLRTTVLGAYHAVTTVPLSDTGATTETAPSKRHGGISG